ncbi:MAG TPA: metallophosphoesterase, partial [Polyangiaceae bacterium]|nr:metallophosphoesterase [Polyangiaceae bacterium]
MGAISEYLASRVLAEHESFVVVSDVHLEQLGSKNTARALAELVRDHPGREIVLGGDVFYLSHDSEDDDAVDSVLRILRAYPELEAALREHLAGGGRLTFIAGNHDASLAEPRMQDALRRHLADAQASLSVARWFIRRGAVHVEHGHMWDPDNAPAHPLAGWS